MRRITLLLLLTLLVGCKSTVGPVASRQREQKFDPLLTSEEQQREGRNRFIPSGLANEILLDTFVRVASFEHGVGMPQRLFDAYAYEVGQVDLNKDGVLAFNEVDEEDTAPNGLKNERLYLPATAFNRFAVTREINDGILAPRFAPSQRAYVLSGVLTRVSPAVPASVQRDADDR